tara:strand:- start:972 stop:3080 length:2109 start_codon:yes stop_codon:yes gene_type:complete
MKVPSYTRQTAREINTGAGRLSVQANPGQFSQTGQAVARLGQAGQTASLNALQLAERKETQTFEAAEKKKLLFFEAEMKNQYEAELAKGVLDYNQGLNDAALKARTMNPNDSDVYFQAQSNVLKKNLSKEFKSKAALNDFLVKADTSFTNKSISVRTTSSNRRIDEQASIHIATIEQLKSQAVIGNEAEKAQAREELFGKNGVYAKLQGLGYWTSVETGVKKQAAQQDILKNSIVNTFQNLGTIEGKESFLETLEKKPPESLGVIGTRALVRSLRTDITNEKSIVKKQAVILKSDLKDANKILTSGGTISVDTISGLENRAKSMGVDGAELRVLANNLKVKKTIFDIARKTNLNSLSAEITKYSTDGIPGVGDPGNNTLLETEIINDLKVLETNMRSELKRDPLTFAERSGNTSITKIDFTSENSAIQIGKRINEANAVSAQYGSQVKFLKDNEANSLKSFFDNSQTTIDAKLAVLNKINEGFGRHSQDVLKELSQKGAPELAHLGGLMKLGLFENAKLAMQGLDLKNNNRQAPEITNINTTTEFSRTVGNALQFMPAAVQGAAKSVTDLIYNKLALDAGEQFFRPNLYERAAKLALGLQGENGGVDDVDGHPTLIPKQLDADKLEDMMENITVDNLSAQGITIDPKLLEDINDKKFNLYAVGDGVYALARGTPGENDFLIAADTSGNQIKLNALRYHGVTQ